MSFRVLRPAARATSNLVASSRRAVLAARLRPAFYPAAGTRSLSVSARRMGSGQTDGNLASALAAEHKFELENAATLPEVPAFVENFKTQGIWEINDIPGEDDVVLTRKFGNETIKLTFQISDLDSFNEPAEFAESEPEVTGEIEPAGPTSIACSLVITKSATPGALMVDLETCEEGFEITNVAVYEKALAEREGADGDWERRSKYMGPQFDHLDQAVQEAFSAYLAERGVDEALADFVLSYCEHKEQKDYVSWLDQVRGFVEK
ncbi:complement component 1 Q subcomponent-binding protein, mitochondrial [Kwoniella heveanensis CBS 569]|nr:complement component 1 Q subcomponent-binding protein, mitochondrial [Kwoniella heveanensis CBS 569]